MKEINKKISRQALYNAYRITTNSYPISRGMETNQFKEWVINFSQSLKCEYCDRKYPEFLLIYKRNDGAVDYIGICPKCLNEAGVFDETDDVLALYRL